MTRKLYEDTPAPLVFSALVTGCVPAKKGYWVTLDQTGFFPEGGGQPCDLGTLSGMEVLDVQLREGEVQHLVPQPLEPGASVEGAIDRERRLDHSQQHTGEHILSGTLHRLFGANNVGFHIGQPYVRMDIDLPLTAAQLEEAEAQANALIQQDLPVKAWYPDPETLESLPYRSKKALEGPVRLVEIPGGDLCACCGTHLERTGMVGIIKIISAENYKGGVRLEVACGGRAIPPIQDQHRQITALSGLLSAKPQQVEQAARRMAGENQALKGQLAQLTGLLIEALAAQAQPGQVQLRFCDGLSPDGLRRLCLALAQRSQTLSGAFGPTEEGFSYALSLPGQDVRPLAKELNQRFEGRGGGSPNLCQGRLSLGEPEEIEKFLEESFHADAL